MCSYHFKPSCGGGSVYFINDETLIEIDKRNKTDDTVNSIINQIYDDRKVDKDTRQALHKVLYEPLKEAVNEGFGGKKVEFGTPNYEMLKNLQTNTAVFAAFKGHAMIKEMAGLLKDKDGNLRSKADYRTEALKIDNTFRVDHLNTQYDTAVRMARMATIWQKAQETKRLYPNLEYLPSRSANPREAHKPYYGIIRAIDDPIWLSIMPSNGFGCECGVRPTDKEETAIPDNLPKPDKGFDFNPGVTGQVFDLKNSGYIKSVPPKEQPRLIKEAEKIVNIEAATEARPQLMYENKATGAKVTGHPMAFDNNDFNEVLQAARSLANWKAGGVKNIEILPDIVDQKLRDQLLPNAKGQKNPDYRLDGEYSDLKTITGSGKKTVGAALDSARQQCNTAVLVITEENELTEDDVVKQISKKMAFPEMKDFGDIWLNYKGKWIKNPQKNKPE